jgi:hypothetical protein
VDPPRSREEGRSAPSGRIVGERRTCKARAIVGAHVNQRHHAVIDLGLAALQRRADILRPGDVFGEVRLARDDAVVFEVVVDVQLFADQRLALGDGARSRRLGDVRRAMKLGPLRASAR